MCSCKSNIDLAFVVDSTLSSAEFQTVVDFVVSVVDWFNVGQNSTRVGVVLIADSGTVSIRLDQFDDRLLLYAAIRSMAANTGKTRSV